MPLYVQEACTLFVTDSVAADSSKHLNLVSAKLPDLEELTQTFYAGGAVGQIEVGGMGLKALEFGFKLAGWDPQTMIQFGLSKPNMMPFTFYGVVRDKNGNAPIEVRSVMRGRMTRAATDDIKRGDLMNSDFAVRELMHYELYFNKVERYYYDWYASIWRVNGVSQNTEENAILRIPGGS